MGGGWIVDRVLAGGGEADVGAADVGAADEGAWVGATEVGAAEGATAGSKRAAMIDRKRRSVSGYSLA